MSTDVNHSEMNELNEPNVSTSGRTTAKIIPSLALPGVDMMTYEKFSKQLLLKSALIKIRLLRPTKTYMILIFDYTFDILANTSYIRT